MATVSDVMFANLDSKATGERLLRDLPWEQKLRARLRSLGLLLVIAGGAFWVRSALITITVARACCLHGS